MFRGTKLGEGQLVCAEEPILCLLALTCEFCEVARLCCICFLSTGTWRYRQGSHSDHHLQVWFATEFISLTFGFEGFTALSKTGGIGFDWQ